MSPTSQRAGLLPAEPVPLEARWAKRVDAPPENPTLPSRDVRPPPIDRAIPSPVAIAASPHVEAEGPPGEKQPTVTCLLCGTSNERGLRYCVTCGHLLAQSGTAPAIRVGTGTVNFNRPSSEPPGPQAAGSSAPYAAPAAPRVETAARFEKAIDDAKRIAPVRVVEVGGPARELAPVLCPRCGGGSDPTAQYCRFCGAAFAAPTRNAATTRATSEANQAAEDHSSSRLATALDEAWTAGVAPERTAQAALAGLVLIARDGGEGTRFLLGASNDIGRAEGDIVLAEDRYMSPRHARIVSRGDAYFIRDLESTNGIFFRIPFMRSMPPSSAEAGSSALVIAGPTTLEPAGAVSHLDPGSEHPLADQELFLIGQQVLRFEMVKHANAGFGVASESGTLLFGTPAAPRLGRLSQRTVEGVVRDVFTLRKAETVIGRESGDIVFTDDPFVSRRHAILRMHEAKADGLGRRFTLADLGSSNGTFLQVRDEVRLRHGDQFRIGQQLFRFDHDVAITGA